MPGFSVEVTISREGDTDLVLSCDTGYNIARNGIGPGAVSWRRITVQSPFVSGRTLVHAIRDVGEVPIKLRVVGDDAEDVHEKINALLQAVSQFSYTITVDIDGVVYSWEAEPADWSVGEGGSWQDLHLRSNTQDVSLSIPVNPNVVGS